MTRRLWRGIITAALVAAVLSVAAPSVATAVVGGAPAASGTWPWLARIVDNLGNGTGETCSGTVVAPNLVLTAAHCVEDVTTGVPDDPSGFTVETGTLDLAAGGQLSAVARLIPHATSWQTRTLPSGGSSINVIGDAALLVLATPTTAPPIPVAGSDDLSLIQPGDGVQFAGWGLTDSSSPTLPTVLQTGATAVQSPLYCRLRNPYFDSGAQLCTVDAPAFTTSICSGDSGGPLIAETASGTWEEVGVTNEADNGCDPALPDTFTRADYLEPWVQSWIDALPPPATPTSPTTPVVAGSQPPAQQAGTYIGKSRQRQGHLDLTTSSGGLLRINIEFTMHCPRRSRGPFRETESWTTNGPLALSLNNDNWGFSTSYTTTPDGWRYAIAGLFVTPTSAAGTLSVTSRNGACRTGIVRWAASA